MDDYSDYEKYKPCECGVDKTFGPGHNIQHSDYCPKYVYSTKGFECQCGNYWATAIWHSPGCRNRVYEKNEVQKPLTIDDAIKLLYGEKK